MRTFSENFLNSLKGIRELNVLVTYKDKNGTMLLTSEDDDKLLTEDSNFIGTETGNTKYNSQTIISAFPKFNTKLMSTVCKMATIESKIELAKGNKFNLKIGVKVGQDFEYMNYGDYLIIEDATYNADTESYTIVGYDRMIESSVKYDDDPLEIEYPITHRDMLKTICNKFSWAFPKVTYINQSKIIENDIYLNQKMTYRDIIDDLLSGTGAILYFNEQNVLNIKYPDFTEPQEIDTSILKNNNVQIKEKYGPVNSIEVITTDGAVLNAIKDNTSIQENGENKLQLNSLLLQNFSNDYLTNLFDKIKGLEYYIYDFDTIGQLIYEPLDPITITIGENSYQALVLNDEIKLANGLEETIYTDKPTIAENDFIVITDEDKKINDAFIKIDKANGQIVLKATSDNKLVLAELNASPEEGSEFNVKADNINLEGYTTINGNFTIDDEGNMECNNATIKGDVYFPETDTEVINSSGILTSITFGSNGSYSGFGLCGFDFNSLTGSSFVKADAGIVYNIPSNFIVTNAYLTAIYTPVHWYDFNANPITGTLRNVSLFKGSQAQCPIYTMGYASEALIDNSQTTGTLITNPFGSGDAINGSETFGTAHILVSRDLKNDINITPGTTQILYLRTNENISNDSAYCAYRTGLVKLSLMLVGYTKFTNQQSRTLLGGIMNETTEIEESNEIEGDDE